MPVINFNGTKSERLAEVKHLLANKFPSRHLRFDGVFPTGIESLDKVEGGLHKASITEVIGSSGLFIESILNTITKEGYLAALIDASYAFDPTQLSQTALARLLWVICADAKQAIKVTDLLLRDANLPIVMLDLQFASDKDLRGIPSSTWHRLQRLIEHSNTAFVVLSKQPMVQGARARVTFKNRWKLSSMRQRRASLVNNLSAHVTLRNQTTTQAFYTGR